MRIFQTTRTASLLLGFLLLSCITNTDDLVRDNVTATVDGRAWRAVGAAASRTQSGDIVTLTMQGIRLIDGVTGQSEVLSIAIITEGEPQPGAYTVREATPKAQISIRNTGDANTSFMYSAVSGTVTLTRYSGGNIRGTFSGELKQGNSENRKTVTNGTFIGDLP